MKPKTILIIGGVKQTSAVVKERYILLHAGNLKQALRLMKSIKVDFILLPASQPAEEVATLLNLLR